MRVNIHGIEVKISLHPIRASSQSGDKKEKDETIYFKLNVPWPPKWCNTGSRYSGPLSMILRVQSSTMYIEKHILEEVNP